VRPYPNLGHLIGGALVVAMLIAVDVGLFEVIYYKMLR
jgi:hypothetical protein